MFYRFSQCSVGTIGRKLEQHCVAPLQATWWKDGEDGNVGKVWPGRRLTQQTFSCQQLYIWKQYLVYTWWLITNNNNYYSSARKCILSQRPQLNFRNHLSTSKATRQRLRLTDRVVDFAEDLLVAPIQFANFYFAAVFLFVCKLVNGNAECTLWSSTSAG